jgi:hypothetical protein
LWLFPQKNDEGDIAYKNRVDPRKNPTL